MSLFGRLFPPPPTRIAALDCRLAQAGERQAEAAAMAAFDAALERDATYATAHAERALAGGPHAARRAHPRRSREAGASLADDRAR